jgi:hypothetical protein
MLDRVKASGGVIEFVFMGLSIIARILAESGKNHKSTPD